MHLYVNTHGSATIKGQTSKCGQQIQRSKKDSYINQLPKIDK